MKSFYLVAYWPGKRGIKPSILHAADDIYFTLCNKRITRAWWMIVHHCKDVNEITCPICRQARISQESFSTGGVKREDKMRKKQPKFIDVGQIWADEMNGKIPKGSYMRALKKAPILSFTGEIIKDKGGVKPGTKRGGV